MFLYGADASGRRFDDYRPEVHDSDGFMAQTGQGQWLWRPLANPRELRVNRFMDENPRGFGLHAARARLRAYRGRRGAVRVAAELLGAAARVLGARAASSWSRFRATRRSTTTSSPTGYPGTAVLGKPLSFTYLMSAYAAEQSSGRPVGGWWPPAAAIPPPARQQVHFPPGARRMLVDLPAGTSTGWTAAQPVKAEVTADNGHVETRCRGTASRPSGDLARGLDRRRAARQEARRLALLPHPVRRSPHAKPGYTNGRHEHAPPALQHAALRRTCFFGLTLLTAGGRHRAACSMCCGPTD